MEKTLLQKLQIWVIECIAKVHWKQSSVLTAEDDAVIREKCINNYYIIVTRKSNYLTTFFIALGNFLLTGQWGFYSHALMNLEDKVDDDSDFRFIEATGAGTHYSTFESVFGAVDAVALITPKNMSIAEWTTALDKSRTYLGRPYDNLFNLKSDLEINCVELIRLALEGTDDYATNFAEFEKLIAKKKLTPDMFVNCPDFKVVYRIKQ